MRVVEVLGYSPTGPDDGIIGDIYIDFVNNIYSVNGVSKTAAQTVDDIALISGSGLLLSWNDPNTVRYIIGDVLAAVLAALSNDFTFILEFEPLENFNMSIFAAFPTSGTGDFFFLESTSTILRINDQKLGESERLISTSAPAFPGIRRTAITRKTIYLSQSVNGGAVGTDTPDLSDLSSFDVVQLGPLFTTSDPDEYAAMHGYIRKIIIFTTPQADVDLPTLSTVA